MTNDKKLLSAALYARDFSELFKYGVNDNWFVEESDKRVWLFSRDHFSKYGEVPSTDVLHETFPGFPVEQPTDSISYLLDSVMTDRRKISISNTILDAIKNVEKDKDHEAALLSLQRGIAKLETDGLSGTSDVDLTNDPLRRWETYLDRKNNPGLLGWATGFPTMDEATAGLQAGQLVVIIATPKTGKSTLALQVALNMHREHRAVPMFQSFEMSNQEQESRYDAMRSLVSHQRLTRGALTPDEESRYKRILQGLSKVEHKFWLVDSAAGSTVSGIASKIQTLQPDIVFIDGVYLMIDEQSGEANTPQALTSITRNLKKLAQKFQIPVVITTQALPWKMKGTKLTADSIGYSSSFFQDADVIFGLQREDESEEKTRLLRIIASRNCGPAEVTLEWGWNEGRFREMDAGDL